jgi:hypothetical protein
MTDTKVENAVCASCGAEARENTLFCYSCGKSLETAPIDAAEETGSVAATGSDVSDAVPDEGRAAIAELEERLKADDATNADKLALAAANRRKARVSQRRSNEFVWESSEDGPVRIFFLISLLIAALAGAVVFLLVYWR